MPQDNILKIENITKSFGVVQALKNVSFTVKKGEIHSILGENGAGKSTLVKIIKGEIAQDSGKLIFEGNEISKSDPLYAISIGISMVHQELTVFENLSIAENIYPNNVFKTKGGLLNKTAMIKKARENLLLFGLDLDPTEKITYLTLAQKQIIEILRSIALKRKLIILDEPTSGLNEVEVKSLMAILKRLKNEGITILYISHRIPEIIEISDSVTVLKDGGYVGTFNNDESLTEKKIINLMVGREIDLLYSKKAYSDKILNMDFIRLENLSKKNSVQDINLTLNKNEILGIFGLEGSGSERLSRILFGLDTFEKGSISIKGKLYRKLAPDILINNGFVYLNRNRKEAGLFLDMPASDNMAAPVLKKFSKLSFLKYKKIQKYTEEYIKKFDIAIPGIKTKPRNLSGGNQQKLMFSMCLGVEPECVVANEPTRGVDVGAKAEIHKFILELPEKGTSVIVFSSELPELLTLCDRVVVMKNNSVEGELKGDNINEESIMSMAAGSSNKSNQVKT